MLDQIRTVYWSHIHPVHILSINWLFIYLKIKEKIERDKTAQAMKQKNSEDSFEID